MRCATPAHAHYQELAMDRSLSLQLPLATARAEAPAMRNRSDSHHALAGLLLAAAMGILLVLADSLIALLPHRQQLNNWVALWTLAFIGMALLAAPLRRLSGQLSYWITQRLGQVGALR
jgi:hypothetical protein